MMKRTACVLFCLVIGCTSASASTINFVGEGKVGVVEISSGLGNNLWVYAGELEWAWSGNPSLVFYTYCVDANNWAHYTQEGDVEPSSALASPGDPDAAVRRRGSSTPSHHGCDSHSRACIARAPGQRRVHGRGTDSPPSLVRRQRLVGAVAPAVVVERFLRRIGEADAGAIDRAALAGLLE